MDKEDIKDKDMQVSDGANAVEQDVVVPTQEPATTSEPVIVPKDKKRRRKETNPTSRTEKSLLFVVGLIVLAAIGISILGFLAINKPAEIIEGQVEGESVRISGKLPGRVVEFYVSEGDTVHAGQRLVKIHSSVVEAQLTQAEAMKEVAQSQDEKVDAGTRVELIKGAADMVAQAQAAVSISQKTYERMENLFNEGVVTEQKRDEAKAAYDAAVAARNAAESQLELAKAGAQKEDKQAAAAMVKAASGNVNQVQAVLEDTYLTAPCDGVIDEIYPQVGELVATGAPLMNLLKLGDRYVTFNVREELLKDLPMGKEITVKIPALGMKEVKSTVYYIRDMGSYAVWHSTKSTGKWDSRTFEIKARPIDIEEDLRPGMSVIYGDVPQQNDSTVLQKWLKKIGL